MKHFWDHTVLAVKSFIRYIPLLENLISRELKKKYRRSLLGYLWCVLNPLMVMLIMNFVFSNMFRNDIANFPVYLFVGRMVFTFIQESTVGVSRSFINNGALMRKTRIPYYIFPMASFSSAIVNFLFSLAAFAIVLLFTQTAVSWHVLAFPVVVVQMLMFAFGLGMILANANVFVRDTDYLYAVFCTAWMYMTPLFYPLQALPQIAQTIIANLNPAYFYIQQSRLIFIDHQWPTGILMAQGFGAAAVFLFVGMWIYVKNKDKIILYV